MDIVLNSRYTQEVHEISKLCCLSWCSAFIINNSKKHLHYNKKFRNFELAQCTVRFPRKIIREATSPFTAF